MDLKYETSNGEFTMDNSDLMDFIGSVMNAPEGTLAHQVRDDWAEIAVSVNVDKLYESAE